MNTIKILAHTVALMSLIDKTNAQPDPTRPIVPMSQYSKANYRILDCAQCFQAQGKMCHHKDYDSMFEDTKSSNMGNAVCCKNDATTGLCGDSKHVCSMPSYDTDANSKYKNVLTAGNRNYQMFAFCPMVNQRACGISNADDKEIQLGALEQEQIVYSKEMRFREGTQDTREYDFCHYEITKNVELTKAKVDKLRKSATGGKVSLNFKLTKKSEMNVYIYSGGKSRDTATEAIIEDNKQVEVNKIYSVDVDSGILVIAYPDKDQDTELAFNYWVAAYKEAIVTPWYEFEGEQGEQLFMYLCGIAAILLLCIICVCCYCCAKNRNKNRVEIVEEQELEKISPKGDGNNTSVQLEDVDDEQNLAYGTDKLKQEAGVNMSNDSKNNNEGGNQEGVRYSQLNQANQHYPTREYGNTFKKLDELEEE